VCVCVCARHTVKGEMYSDLTLGIEGNLLFSIRFPHQIMMKLTGAFNNLFSNKRGDELPCVHLCVCMCVDVCVGVCVCVVSKAELLHSQASGVHWHHSLSGLSDALSLPGEQKIPLTLRPSLSRCLCVSLSL